MEANAGEYIKNYLHLKRFPRISLHCKLAPVQYWEYEHGLLLLLYSWRFSRYSAPIYWLVHGHMTSNNETVSRQKPCGQHCENYDFKRETVHYYPRNVDRCCTWTEHAVEGGLMFSQESQNLLLFCFVLLYNKSINDWSLGKQWILFTSNLETLRLLENKIHCSPRGPSLSVYFDKSQARMG